MEEKLRVALRFFLPYYYIADLLSKRLDKDRRATLLKARTEAGEFLKLLDNYDALSPSDARLYERYRETPDSFSTASVTDAAARRHAKIARFKEEKSLKQKLEVRPIPLPVERIKLTANQFLRQNPSVLRDDDAVARELHLTNITYSTYQAFQLLESIAQELDILRLAPPVPRDGADSATADARDRSNGRPRDDYSERLDGPLSDLLANGKAGPILSPDGRPLRPFTLLDTRQRLQQGVFRPDHNLPTMTIDEYLEEERRRGGIIEGGGAQSGIKPQVDEDDMDIADKETFKARAWDDFKDDNPRGAGNTMNMG